MKTDNYLAIVNEKTEVPLTQETAQSLDAVEAGNGSIHIVQHGKTYHAEISEVNLANKEISLKLNGKQKHVKIQDEYDLLVKKMGLSANVIHKISAIKAPMPGLVLSILVEAGQDVVHGEPMLVLEAMKMENIIKSPGEGRVKKIVVEKGKPVDKGQVLIEME